MRRLSRLFHSIDRTSNRRLSLLPRIHRPTLELLERRDVLTGSGLLISEIFTNPSGSDSPFEYVELVATRSIDFTATPYSVVFADDGPDSTPSNGWVTGGLVTYGFSIASGTVSAGDVVYVGGSSMAPTGTKLRVINTATTAGDGFGSPKSGGVLGNGGPHSDGIAVFDVAIGSLTSSTVPVDAVFFSTAIGTAFLSSNSGYQLPINDHYGGGRLPATDLFLAPDPGANEYLIASGNYSTSANAFTAPRTWTVASSRTATTAIQLVSTAIPSIRINEVVANPPSELEGSDQYQYVELRGPANTSLANVYLVQVDGNGLNAGIASFVINLSTYSLGSNGLLMIKSATGGHAAGAGTTVVTDPRFDATFGPLSKSTVSFYLVLSAAPIVEAANYDSDLNGVLDGVLAAALRLDNVGWSDGDDGDRVYSSVVLRQNQGTPDAATRLATDTTAGSIAAWFNGDLYDLNGPGGEGDPAELLYDATRRSDNMPLTPNTPRLTPGAENFQQPPIVTSITPFSGPTSGGSTVVISGSNLLSASDVKFGATSAIFTVNSDTQITATSPIGTGIVGVSVVTPFGSSTPNSQSQFSYVAVAAPQFADMVVNGGAMFAVDSYGFSPTGLIGHNSVVTQLYVEFDVGVTLEAGAFTLDAGPVSINIAGGVAPVPVGTDVVTIIAEPQGNPEANGGYKGYRLRFTGSPTYLNTFDNGPTGTGGLGNVATTLKDGFYTLNIAGSKVHFGGSTAGTPMVGTIAERFWVLFGSVDASDRDVAGEGHSGSPGDGTSVVSVNSSVIGFAAANGFGGGTSRDSFNPNFDWNLDGDVADDLIEFAQRFGLEWSF
jgi:hypothetical protein